MSLVGVAVTAGNHGGGSRGHVGDHRHRYREDPIHGATVEVRLQENVGREFKTWGWLWYTLSYVLRLSLSISSVLILSFKKY